MEEKRPQTATDEPRWTAQDVAKFLVVSPSWVYLKANDGTIPCLRYGAHLRFDPEVIRRYARGENVAPRPVVALKIHK